jgi:hypothetical protein
LEGFNSGIKGLTYWNPMGMSRPVMGLLYRSFECEVHEVSVLNLQRRVVTTAVGLYMQMLNWCM